MTYVLGARRGIGAGASERGTFAVLALDHRQNLRKEVEAQVVTACGAGATTDRERLARLVDVVDTLGTPWHARSTRLTTAPAPGDGWYRGY